MVTVSSYTTAQGSATASVSHAGPSIDAEARLQDQARGGALRRNRRGDQGLSAVT